MSKIDDTTPAQMLADAVRHTLAGDPAVLEQARANFLQLLEKSMADVADRPVTSGVDRFWRLYATNDQLDKHPNAMLALDQNGKLSVPVWVNGEQVDEVGLADIELSREDAEKLAEQVERTLAAEEEAYGRPRKGWG